MTDHPAPKTEEEIAELRASDPAAFDDDVPEDAAKLQAGDPIDDVPDDKAERPRDENGKFLPKDAKPDDVKADEPEAKLDEPAAKDAKADEDDGKVARREFDGVLSDLQRQREENKQMKERLAAIEAEKLAAETGDGRDFDTEIEALEQKYDDGDVEFADYQKDMKELVVAKTRAEVLTEVATREQETQKQAAERQWAEAQATFLAVPEHADLVANKYRRAAFLEALQDAANEGIADNAKLLEAARDKVLAEFPQAKAADDKAPTNPADPHAARKASDAAASTKASATPPSINGGTGNRAGVVGAVDLQNLKPGTFSSKLSAADQEKLLGPGAL